MIRLSLIIFLFFIISCSRPAIDISTCEPFGKITKKYIKCLEDLVNRSNAGINIKEFGKHKTGHSFFKRVTVQPSN